MKKKSIKPKSHKKKTKLKPIQDAIISVIVPICQSGEFLPLCLDNILSQTFHDFEVICIDDGSLDRSKNILKKYQKKDSRIQVIAQKNASQAMARNSGLEVSHGKYVLFLEPDDQIHPQLLEACCKYGDEYNADIINYEFQKLPAGICSKSVKYDVDKVPFSKTNTPLKYIKKGKTPQINFMAWGRLYRRRILDGVSFIEGSRCTEDLVHTMTVLSKHPKTILLNEPLYFHTITQPSVSCRSYAVRTILDMHQSILMLHNIYQGRPKEHRLVERFVFSNLLKQQLEGIRRSPIENRPPLYQAFTSELKDLKAKGCFHWYDHKLKNYLVYRKLMKKEVI